MNVIKKLRSYMNDCLFPPEYSWSEDEFQKRSYSRWAAEEILSLLQSTNKDPIDIVEDFADEIERFSESTYQAKRIIFFAVQDTIDDILFLLKGELH